MGKGADKSDGRAKRVVAYRLLAEHLREELERGEYAEGRRLPTEAELRERFGVSRHTVREALGRLIADGLIYRVPGRGTFASGRAGTDDRYLRTIGSLEEIMVFPLTEMKPLEPFHPVTEPEIAKRLELPGEQVYTATVLRSFEGIPFVLTDHFVAPELGETLREREIPSGGDGTVIGAAEEFLPHPVAGAHQDITAMAAPAGRAELIGCEPGEPILMIERLFYDAAGAIVEYTTSHFNPHRYSYSTELRRRSE